ncbi:O-antigen ligase family protein [Azospirillum sp. TSO22-1]|uniref:O-antigen ligase family protein n=1 Tax=Azospirillum sp. TSO22-1 TaxID=716789 RepID=UPI0011B63815|nr:O-antigen ligase family protein [Azospirillum sp. TSO22-1]
MMLLALCLSSGYLIFGRPFAYLGVTPFYPAELYLLLAALFLPRRWLGAMIGDLLALRPVALLSALVIAWGVVSVARGLEAGYDPEIALKEFSAHYYVLYFFVGRAVSHHFHRRRAALFFVISGLLAGINCIIYALYTSRIELFLPWAPEVPAFDVPAMLSYPLVGLTAFAPYTGVAGVVAIIVDLVASLTNPGRALWLSMLLGCGVVFALRPDRRMVVKVVISVLVVVAVVYSVGSLIPAAEGRGGSLSPMWVVAQVLSTFDPEMAHDLLIESDEGVEASTVYSRFGTINWRYTIWEFIIDSLDSAELWFLGHGYGLELPSLIIGAENLRSPHNFILYLLGYTGLIGLAIYLSFSGALLGAFYRLPRSPYRSFLLGQFASVWTLAMFGNALETPFVTVPYYLGMGMAYGAAVIEARSVKKDNA